MPDLFSTLTQQGKNTMGTRVLYEIMGEIDEEKKPVCILYSNSSHPDHDLEALFQAAVTASRGPTECVVTLLNLKYQKDGGNHGEGDRMFWITTTPYGDYDHKLTIDFDSDEKLIERIERDTGLKI
jgi:hypothetical protein